jgi:hypothetical protein
MNDGAVNARAHRAGVIATPPMFDNLAAEKAEKPSVFSRQPSVEGRRKKA